MPGCEDINLVFVIDASGSITEANADTWLTMKTFLERVVGRLDVGVGLTRVGTVKFSSTAMLEFNLDQYTAKLVHDVVVTICTN